MLKRDEKFTYTHRTDGGGYKNPLNRELDTADPCIIYNERDGYYYGIYTGWDKLTMHRSRCIRDMFSSSESRVIYEPRDADGTYGFLWAPEIHVIDGVWYIYTSTHEKDTKAHKHLICLKTLVHIQQEPEQQILVLFLLIQYPDIFCIFCGFDAVT